jgi:hypothetical protein
MSAQIRIKKIPSSASLTGSVQSLQFKVAVFEAKEVMKRKVTKQSILHDLEELKSSGKPKGKEKTKFAGLLVATLWAP